MGFVLESEEAQEWIAADARNAEVLFPYLNGEDLNQRAEASASRWVIDFNDRPEAEAATYPLPFKRVSELVKPERMQNKRKPRRHYWWQFAERAAGMRKATAGLPEVLVIALVSKSVMPMRVPTGQVFSHMLGVFAIDNYGVQAILSSSLHQLWAITYGSTLETRVRYTPSDVFETFPLPAVTPRLIAAGLALDEQRREVMLRRDLGLTRLYNLVNEPAVQGDIDVTHLRDIHVEIDEAVVAAYGWDLRLAHGFFSYRQVERWSLDAASRVDALDLLLLENHRRAGGHRSPTPPSASDPEVPANTLFD